MIAWEWLLGMVFGAYCLLFCWFGFVLDCSVGWVLSFDLGFVLICVVLIC